MGVACSTCCSTRVSHTVQLPEQLETGDLILFRTNTIAARVTRWCTDAPFDHVAMVLRTADGFRTVECTGQGIGCWQLQERLDDYIIKGAVIRRLRTALTNDMVRELNAFLQSVKHKPYRLNQNILGRMLRTCLCCQRVGQHTTEAAQAQRERARQKKSQSKYASSATADDERKERDGEDAEATVVNGGEEEDGVAIPTLLPPEHDPARPDPVRPASPVSPSGRAAPSPSSSPRGSISPSAKGSAAAAGDAAHVAAATSSPATAAASSNGTALRRKSNEMDLRSAKAQLELRDHEHLREHFPLAEDIASLHLKPSFFCSSFIAACYMRMGLLPAWPPIDYYLPATFSSQTAVQAPLQLGAEFAEECLIEKPSADTNPRKWSRVQREAQAQQKLEKERRERETELQRRDVAAAAGRVGDDIHVVDLERETSPPPGSSASPLVPLASPTGAASAASPPAVAAATASGGRSRASSSAAAVPAPQPSLRSTAPLPDSFRTRKSHSRSAQQGYMVGGLVGTAEQAPTTANGAAGEDGRPISLRRAGSHSASLSSNTPSDLAPVRRSPNIGPQIALQRHSLSRNSIFPAAASAAAGTAAANTTAQPTSSSTYNSLSSNAAAALTPAIAATTAAVSRASTPNRTPSPGSVAALPATVTNDGAPCASASSSSLVVLPSVAAPVEVVPTVMRTKSVLRPSPLTAATEQQQQTRGSDSPRKRVQISELASPSGGRDFPSPLSTSPPPEGSQSAAARPPLLRAGSSKVGRLPPLHHTPSNKLAAASVSDSDED